MRRLLTVLRDPVAWILVVAGVIELLSGGTAARGAILFAGSILIVVDRIRIARARSIQPSLFDAEALQATLAAPGWLALAVIAVLVAASLDVHTLPMTAIVGLTGVVAVGWAWLTQPEAASIIRPSLASLLTWGGLFLALGLWELGALMGQPNLEVMSPDSPTLSYLAKGPLETYPGRAAALGLWMIAGRTLVRRS